MNGHIISGRQILRAAGEIKRVTKLKIRTNTPTNYTEFVINTIISHETTIGVLHKSLRLPSPTLPPNKQPTKRPVMSLSLYERDLREFTQKITALVKEDDDYKGRDPLSFAAAIIVGADVLIGKARNRRRGYLTQRALAEAIPEVAEFTMREHYLNFIKPLIKEFFRRF
jgi:transcription initiation factor TFIIIB Brf1 subunit/transcription initiation factor TFIIB